MAKCEACGAELQRLHEGQEDGVTVYEMGCNHAGCRLRGAVVYKVSPNDLAREPIPQKRDVVQPVAPKTSKKKKTSA